MTNLFVTFIVIFIGLLLFVALMAVGVMLKRKPIAGSCGGLAGVGIDKACDCDKPCEDAKIEMDKRNDDLSKNKVKIYK